MHLLIHPPGFFQQEYSFWNKDVLTLSVLGNLLFALDEILPCFERVDVLARPVGMNVSCVICTKDFHWRNFNEDSKTVLLRLPESFSQAFCILNWDLTVGDDVDLIVKQPELEFATFFEQDGVYVTPIELPTSIISFLFGIESIRGKTLLFHVFVEH